MNKNKELILNKLHNIMISFIIAVFNNEKYLPNALDSIIEQKSKNIEIIIVDDGSTDNTAIIADDYALKYPFIRVIHQKNQWIYASFNNGIKAACGEYIYILNSDDLLFNDSIELLLNKIKEYQYPDVIWTKVVEFYCDEEQRVIGHHEYPTVEPITDEIYAENEFAKSLWPRLRLADLTENQANLYKRIIAVKHPFRNDITYADVYFNLDIAKDIYSYVVLKEPIYKFMIYDTSKGNTCTRYYPYIHKTATDLYIKYRELFIEWNLDVNNYKKSLKVIRMRFYTVSIRSMARTGCSLSVDEKIKKVFLEFLDKDMIDFAEWADGRRELESRTLNGVAELLSKEALPINSDMLFVYDLISGLPEQYYEKVDYSKVDMGKIRSAVFNPMNPARIGREYYGLD